MCCACWLFCVLLVCFVCLFVFVVCIGFASPKFLWIWLLCYGLILRMNEYCVLVGLFEVGLGSLLR